ncbi:unnamed protein product [Rhizophagus irregularis]|nr:unnamed protein product [Rhizophagus irregularis]
MNDKEFDMNDKEFDMNDKEFDMNDKEFDMNDKELNENSSLFSNITQEYKIPLPFAIIFILAGLFILVFSFVVNVECPKDKPNCDLREKTAQQLAPILISYGFLFVALTCLFLLPFPFLYSLILFPFPFPFPSIAFPTIFPPDQCCCTSTLPGDNKFFD